MNPSVYRHRTTALHREVGGPVLLLGNGDRDRNLPGNPLPFRQDSSLLYFSGCAVPGAALLIAGGESTLYLPTPSADDAIWHGETASPAEIARAAGADRAANRDELEGVVRSLKPATIAVSDAAVNAWASALLGTELAYGQRPGDEALIRAIVELRRAKGPEEVAAMREAAAHSIVAHRAAMRATHPGSTERGLAALFEAVLAIRGCTPGYGTILSQRGEVLHNHDHDGILEAGRLLLLDGGGEVASGHTADITRVWPVSGTWTARQRAAYNAVLAANEAGIALCRPGVEYRSIHFEAARILSVFLRDEGLIRCSPEEAVETGAHALFFPHGVGHLIGMDVHDLRNFGDRPAYPAGVGRSPQFGTAYLRLNLPLEAGWVVTIEPGFYVVPAILHDRQFRERFGAQVDFDRAEQWIGFGGIRIEDDVHITPEGPEVFSGDLEKDPDAVASLVGAGRRPEELLC